MKKASLLTILAASLALLFFQGCGGGSGFYVFLLSTAKGALGPPPCDDCTAATVIDNEAADAGDFVHGGTCPQLDEGSFGFEGLQVTSIGCTDEDGFTALTSPCADETEDCKTNDETFDMIGVSDTDLSGEQTESCCDVLSANMADEDAFFFDGWD